MKNINNKDIEVEPTNKFHELLDFLQGYKLEIHKKDEEEYNYLEENSVCITILNSSSKQKIYIDLEEEFTLSYNTYHAHYAPYLDEYEEMTETLRGILNNEIGVASLYYSEHKKWISSTLISKEESLIVLIKKVFLDIFKVEEYKNKLKKNGGEVQYCFWNSVDDRVIKIDKKDDMTV